MVENGFANCIGRVLSEHFKYNKYKYTKLIGIAQTSVTNVKLPGWTVQCLALGWGHCPGSSRFPSRTHLPPRGWGGARGVQGGWVFVRFKHFIWHFVILTFDHVQKQKSP